MYSTICIFILITLMTCMRCHQNNRQLTLYRSQHHKHILDTNQQQQQPHRKAKIALLNKKQQPQQQQNSPFSDKLNQREFRQALFNYNQEVDNRYFCTTIFPKSLDKHANPQYWLLRNKKCMNFFRHGAHVQRGAQGVRVKSVRANPLTAPLRD